MLSTIIGLIGTGCLAAIGWTFQHVQKNTNDIGILETKSTDIKELINTRFDAIDQRLTRIERAMNGSLKGY